MVDAESLEEENTGQKVGDAQAQANNPLANMVAFNVQNYYIGKLTESDENANQFRLRYHQPCQLVNYTFGILKLLCLRNIANSVW